MKNTRRYTFCGALFAVFFLSIFGCAWSSEDEEFADRAVNLGYVAVAVQGYVKYANPPESVTGEDLITEATRANPGLLLALKDFYLVARREGLLTSVLMCNKEKTRAIAEDAGCTAARLDGRLWNVVPRPTCTFQLNLSSVCAPR